ncbi:unnamed protein product [Pleuronectes platessa]|uniref:Uncharacterized protein n=1 Tax=Pleuronectes platessa TaxID=8262 RepID=A0A9N7UUN2_PLEPL|nr:unnamed protein product [Pleuronectes platessa]
MVKHSRLKERRFPVQILVQPAGSFCVKVFLCLWVFSGYFRFRPQFEPVQPETPLVLQVPASVRSTEQISSVTAPVFFTKTARQKQLKSLKPIPRLNLIQGSGVQRERGRGIECKRVQGVGEQDGGEEVMYQTQDTKKQNKHEEKEKDYRTRMTHLPQGPTVPL